jgi:hypothetical protein
MGGNMAKVGSKVQDLLDKIPDYSFLAHPEKVMLPSDIFAS